METKRNLKYFRINGIQPIGVLGAILILIGVIVLGIFVDAEQSLRWISFVGIAIAVAGCVCLYLVLGGRSSAEDLDYQIYERTKFLDETAQKRLEVYQSQFSKVIKPVTLKGYDYLTEDIYYKKGKDNKNRSNVYNTCVLYFTKDKMYYYGKHFSLTDELFDRELMGNYKFTELDRAEVIDGEREFMVGSYKTHVKTHAFVIYTNDGKEVINMTVDYGADTDKAVEDINRVIAVAKDAAAL